MRDSIINHAIFSEHNAFGRFDILCALLWTQHETHRTGICLQRHVLHANIEKLLEFTVAAVRTSVNTEVTGNPDKIQVFSIMLGFKSNIMLWVVALDMNILNFVVAANSSVKLNKRGVYLSLSSVCSFACRAWKWHLIRKGTSVSRCIWSHPFMAGSLRLDVNTGCEMLLVSRPLSSKLISGC